MNRFFMFLIIALFSGGMFLPAVHAAKSGSNADIPNGRPFQALLNLIEANQQIIISNQGDIDALENSVSILQGSVSNINVSIADLDARVTSNTNDLSDAKASLADLNTITDQLISEVRALTAGHQTDMASLKAEIANTQTQIESLAGIVTALANDLAAKVGQLNVAIDENTIAIDDLLLQVVTLNAEISGVNSTINGLQATISTINAQIDGQAGLLADIEFRLVALEDAQNLEPDTAVSVTFEVLNAGCYDYTRPLTFSFNGQVIAESTTDSSTCSCDAPITTVTATDVTLNDVENTLSFETPYTYYAYVAWAKATVNYSNGTSTSVCIYDYAGGNCVESNLCTAGYTINAISQTIAF